MSNDTSRRLELRELNQQAWNGEVVLKLAAKQDSSLKKNTAFVRKLRTSLNSEQYRNVVKDVETLSLEKYSAEIVTPLVEGTMKVAKNDDLLPATEIISALHQRLNLQFTPFYLSQIVNSLVGKEKADSATKQRTILKLVTELALTGVAQSLGHCDQDSLCPEALRLGSKHPEDFILIPLLKDVLSYRFQNAYALSIMISWLKRYAFLLSEEDSLLLSERDLAVVKQICDVYFEKVVDLLQSSQKQRAKLEISNKKAMIRTGKVLEDRQQELEDITKLVEVLENGAPILAELLNREMPVLDTSAVGNDDADTMVRTSTTADANGAWEDKREQDFYTKVPSRHDIYAKEASKIKKKEYAKLSEGEAVVHFLEKFENATTEDDMEKLTAEFNAFIPSNKATHNRLLRFFLEVKKIDNVNLFARFLKINEDLFPELISELIEALDRGFRSSIYRDVINFKNLSFFVELIKFKLIPTHVVFHKIRRLTLNIEGTSNADILSIFYERCGKFLLNEPEYQETTREMLALLNKQSKSPRLSVNEKLALRNMFLIVNSFTSSKNKITQPTSELSPMEDFVTQMVTRVAWKEKSKLPAEILKKIDFKNCQEARDTFVSLYSRPEELGLDKLDMYAKVLKRMGGASVLPALVVDELTEKVIRGLELNDYRQNIARIAQMRFFVALFTRNVISFRSIIDLLYKVVSLGHPNNLPLPGSRLGIDPADNYFRISLCCSVLSNISFSRVERARLLVGGVKSLEGFLTFFQYYISTKKRPLPQEVEFAVADVYSKMFIPPALDNPALALSVLQKFNTKTVEKPKVDEADLKSVEINGEEDEALVDSSDDDDSDVDTDDEHASVKDDEEDLDGLSDDEDADVSQVNGEHGSEQDDDEGEDVDSNDDTDDSDEEEHEGDISLQEVDEEEDESSWSKLKESEDDQGFMDAIDAGIRDALQESLHTSSSRPKGTFKLPAPSTVVAASEQKNVNPPSAPGGTVKFSFLSRKQNIKQMNIPADNQFVDRVVKEQAAQKANRDKIISLINNMQQ